MQPPYYAQQMASANHQPLLVSSICEGAELDVTATRNEAGDTLVLHIVNWAKEDRTITVKLEGLGEVKEATIVSLAGPDDARNTAENPLAYVPATETVQWNGEVGVKGNSYTILVAARRH